MSVTSSSLRPQRYINPDKMVGKSGAFDVLPISGSDPRPRSIAWMAQKIMYDAWVAQFAGQLTEPDIALTVNHHDPGLVNAQLQRILETSPGQQPAYVRAQTTLDSISVRESGRGENTLMIGFGKSDEAGRADEPKLADVSNIYVQPDYQSKGVGSAVLHMLLHGFDRRAETVVYDYEFNERLEPVLRDLGFRAIKTWRIQQFGTEVPQVYYRGQQVGDLIDQLEEKRPWLKRRFNV